MKARYVLWQSGWFAFGMFAAMTAGGYVGIIRGDPGANSPPLFFPFMAAFVTLPMTVPFWLWLVLRVRPTEQELPRQFYIPLLGGIVCLVLMVWVVMGGVHLLPVDVLGEAISFVVFPLALVPSVVMAEICVQIGKRWPGSSP